MKQKLPYGTWPSAITTSALVGGSVGISEVVPDGDDIWWAESRPSEGGRTALMRHRNGSASEMLPTQFNVRTAVHEYGGGGWWVDNGQCFFVDFKDQMLRRLDDDGSIAVLSPNNGSDNNLRFADFRLTPDRHWVIAVAEKHNSADAEPANLIVAIANDGSGRMLILSEGADFYSSPRVSPDGRQLCWVQWSHPNMPWDDTVLMLADLATTAEGISVTNASVVAGGPGEAIVQPEWSPGAELHYLSDSNDFWQLFKAGEPEAVLALNGDIGYPPWVFGLSRYAFLDNTTIAAACFEKGVDTLDGFPEFSAFFSLHASNGKLAFAAAGWESETAVVFDGVEIREPRRPEFDLELLNAAERIEFPTGNNDIAHALYFAPTHPEIEGPESHKPPLIVLAHGGPTAAARSQLSLARHFWTSRGFAVVDVNYRGSCGFGRAYRKKLDGQWGVADVEDCVNAANFLVERGDVDKNRLIIRGGSAGGFTVLSALAFHDVFTAGANMYGVADLEALADDTHKFESRYLDNLVGPYPEQKSLYQERSPVRHLDGFDVPMIVLQGSEDKIVPPNQSRMIVEALDTQKVPVAYLEFEGEQHGFRKAETIETALASELAFYGRVFGFDPAGQLPELEIRNMD